MDNRTTVIIADNAEEFCSSLTAALQRADGFQVLGTANDGEQAIRLVTEKKPDVLVLDLMLAKKDGLSVLKALSSMDRLWLHPVLSPIMWHLPPQISGFAI